MIIRKPYAILIKNFKLIHAILTICMIFLTYKSYTIYSFFVEYMKTSMLAANKDLTAELFSTYMFVLPIIIIIGLVIILVVMIRKKKPFLFYVINLIIYGGTIGIYSYLYNTINYIEGNIMAMKDIKLAHDITLILLGFQLVSMILSFVRAVGFDIKKFDFGKDLVELDIQEEDEEEVEVSVNVEANVIQRGVNRKKRFAKYVYLENKFFINTLVLIFIIVVSYLVYLNNNVYNVVYNEGTAFFAGNLEMRIDKSYITSLNYKGENVVPKDKTLLLLEVYIKSLAKNQKINTGKTEMLVGDKTFFPTKIEYRGAVFDLGTAYYDEVLDMSYQKVLLLYEIPKNLSKANMQFKYVNDLVVEKGKLNPKYIRVDLKPKNIDEKTETKEVELKEEITLNEYNFGTSTFIVNSFELKEEFPLKYNFCIKNDWCMKSTEYLRAPLNTNKDQALLKINAIFNRDEEMSVEKMYGPKNLINYFGKIVYKLDGKIYTLTNGFNFVEPSRVKSNNNYYLVVPKELINSENIILYLNIRNKEYKYQIK